MPGEHMIRRSLIVISVVVAVGVVAAVIVVPTLWRQIMADYDRDHQPDAVETIPVHVHMMPGAPNEKIIKGSDLIEYQGDVRMIVAEERGRYLIDEIRDISTSIPKMQVLGPYCVELLLPRAQYNNASSDVIEKAKSMGLVFCSALPPIAKACPSTELAGIKDHPFTATVMESSYDPATHNTAPLKYKMARDKNGLLYTYKTQTEDGIARQVFEIDDPAHNTDKIWNEGEDQGQLITFPPSGGPSQDKLLNLQSLGNKQMEGFDVDGHSLTCSLGGTVRIHYESWASVALASYIDLVTETTAQRDHIHLSDIHLGENGLDFFKPTPQIKFLPPDSGD
jgi:hypothetical protein